MSYKVTLFNYYAGGEEDFVQFDTETRLLHEVRMDAEIEMFTNRMHNGRNYTDRPIKQVLTAYPTLEFTK